MSAFQRSHIDQKDRRGLTGSKRELLLNEPLITGHRPHFERKCVLTWCPQDSPQPFKEEFTLWHFFFSIFDIISHKWVGIRWKLLWTFWFPVTWDANFGLDLEYGSTTSVKWATKRINFSYRWGKPEPLLHFCLTERWLCGSIRDSALQLAGLQLFKARLQQSFQRQ